MQPWEAVRNESRLHFCKPHHVGLQFTLAVKLSQFRLMIKPGIAEFHTEFRAEFIHVFTSLRRAVVLAGWVFAVVC